MQMAIASPFRPRRRKTTRGFYTPPAHCGSSAASTTKTRSWTPTRSSARAASRSFPAGAPDAGDTEFTLLDTPGHVDFSAEMERTLQVLDYAVLVISGTDGVQSHTETLWQLLRRYRVPVFLFVNKMDLAGADRGALLAHLRRPEPRCVDFGNPETGGGARPLR